MYQTVIQNKFIMLKMEKYVNDYKRYVNYHWIIKLRMDPLKFYIKLILMSF